MTWAASIYLNCAGLGACLLLFICRINFNYDTWGCLEVLIVIVLLISPTNSEAALFLSFLFLFDFRLLRWLRASHGLF